jgi:hypothetical protein
MTDIDSRINDRWNRWLWQEATDYGVERGKTYGRRIVMAMLHDFGVPRSLVPWVYERSCVELSYWLGANK